MAITVQQIQNFLNQEGIRYRIDQDRIIMGWNTDQYKDYDGDKTLMIVIELLERGEYLKIFSPNAFQVKRSHQNQWWFFKACLMIQWKTKLVQFEYDDRDGEVRPIVEFPVEDSTLTRAQVVRCIRGLVHLLDEYYPVLHKALNDGVIDFPPESQHIERSLADLISSLPDELVADALREADRRRRGGR